LQALAVPAIAGVGAYLARQQVIIARTKLRHDLFDRRFKVFEAARRFLVAVMRSGKMSVPDLNEYTAGMLDAQFLLSQEVHAYLFEIRKRASAMQAVAAQNSGMLRSIAITVPPPYRHRHDYHSFRAGFPCACSKLWNAEIA
jgi:hypothetical protein